MSTAFSMASGCMVTPLRLGRLDKAAGSADAGAVDASVRQDIRSSLKGDGQAYARIIRRYQEQIAARMRRFTRNAHLLEELVQEIFVEAYFALPGYRGDAPLDHWLNRIATRVGYRFWKRQRRRPAMAELQSWHAPAVEPELGPAHAAEHVHRVLAQLPPRDRLVLTLLYLEERPVAEAARLIGWSQTMVKVQAFRARRKLRKLLEKTEEK